MSVTAATLHLKNCGAMSHSRSLRSADHRRAMICYGRDDRIEKIYPELVEGDLVFVWCYVYCAVGSMTPHAIRAPELPAGSVL